METCHPEWYDILKSVWLLILFKSSVLHFSRDLIKPSILKKFKKSGTSRFFTHDSDEDSDEDSGDDSDDESGENMAHIPRMRLSEDEADLVFYIMCVDNRSFYWWLKDYHNQQFYLSFIRGEIVDPSDLDSYKEIYHIRPIDQYSSKILSIEFDKKIVDPRTLLYAKCRTTYYRLKKSDTKIQKTKNSEGIVKYIDTVNGYLPITDTRILTSFYSLHFILPIDIFIKIIEKMPYTFSNCCTLKPLIRFTSKIIL